MKNRASTGVITMLQRDPSIHSLSPLLLFFLLLLLIVLNPTRKQKQRRFLQVRATKEDVKEGTENYWSRKWGFRANQDLTTSTGITIRGLLQMLDVALDAGDPRPMIRLGHGDPSLFPCFRTSQIAEDAIVEAVRSAKFNHYPPFVGMLPARRAVAEYLSLDLPYKLSPDDVFLTLGCTQAIEIALSVLACPGANILLPRPGFPLYEARAAFNHLEIRHYDLLPEKGWEVDIDSIENLADENTVAMVIINPGNPCGNVFTYQHLRKVSETAKKLGILVISDEVYGHLTFGNNPFVPMGVFGSIVPVLTLGSISKRWIVPGWRLGWLVTSDPNGMLKRTQIVDCIKVCLNISSDPATFVQGALPQILGKTQEDFFKKIASILRQTSEICFEKIKEIDCITCPQRPEGSMFVMVKLNVSLLEDINDDIDFCYKLAKEESVIVLPGIAVGMKNWLRITFAVEPSSLEDAMGRIRSFCQRHKKRQ
ncbi:PREDICTED: probable aminotransferase TAT2 [Nelumbo nucifera]|uniref:Probable aminotransferase TAT2 n=1 Tax=Nelumbo nucifera TaxID=4432 RepID=A0A1U8B7V1_NELNU|nr:PREDICTED: probable aminotransferase TAT2 [Nelumbo nucifera]